MKLHIASIDLLRGVVMVIMALDHVRAYFAYGTWYVDPTDLATTTPFLFFTRWITHFCAPVFIYLAGISAYLRMTRTGNTNQISVFLLTRGTWLVLVELIVVNFAWTFDITYSFRLLQVIWAIGISMIALAGMVHLPVKIILVIGVILVVGHNLLDGIKVDGTSISDLLWYTLHQPKFLVIESGNIVNFVYPVLPWIGLMSLGYACGILYREAFDPNRRRRLLLGFGVGLSLLFLLLRGFNLYGEPLEWSVRGSFLYSLLAFLDTTKYPPSLHFLLMTLGPALIFLSFSDKPKNRFSTPLIVFGRVPFFFYVVHLYFIHALAMLYLVYSGREAGEYVLSAGNLLSGRLSNFGLGLEAVYLHWILVVAAMYPLCKWYQKVKQEHPSAWWLGFL